MKKDLLKVLPSSWKDIKLKDFIKLMEVEVSESNDLINGTWNGVDNTVRVISVLTDTPVEDLEELPYYQLAVLAEKISFMKDYPQPLKKSLIEWKPIDKITYDNFITYNQLQQSQLQNLHVIIKAFSKNEMTEEQILELDMLEVVSGFFILKKAVHKSLNHMILFSMVKLIKQLMKEKMMKWLPLWAKTKK